VYPAGELSELARSKLALRQRIAARRAGCVDHAARVTRPLQWLNRAHARWRRLSPVARLALVPLGLLLARGAARPGRRLAALLRTRPTFVGLVRGLAAVRL
jgi:hypothetical protein